MLKVNERELSDSNNVRLSKNALKNETLRYTSSISKKTLFQHLILHN